MIRQLVFCVALFVTSGLTASSMDLEVRGAYFYPLDHDLRKVYPGNAQLGIEMNVQLWDPVYSWIGANYFRTKGKTIGDRDSTRLTIVPCSIGMKYMYKGRPLQPYVGAGLLTSYVRVHVDSDFLIRSQSKWAIGGLFKAGCRLTEGGYFFDLFVDYALQYVRMHRRHNQPLIIYQVNISGFAFGSGVGILF